MASCTTFPSSSSPSSVNFRASAQERAWETYYELQESIPDAIDANESIRDLQKEAEGPVAERGKRGRESGSPEVGRKVVRKLGEHDIRLTQTQARNPPGFTPIPIPTYDNEATDSDWRPHHGLKMAGVKRSGVRPANTLDRPTVQAVGTAQTFFGNLDPVRPAALSTRTVKGGNVRKGQVHTVFDEHQAGEHSPKRQKISAPDRRSQQGSSQAIDLTDEGIIDLDLFTGIPHSRNRGGSEATPSVRKGGFAGTVADPFAAGESMRAASFTADKKQSKSAKRRSNSDGRNGSERSSLHGSARSLPIDVLDSSVEDLAGSRNSPVVIGEGRNGRRVSSPAQRPPIELDRDLPKGGLSLSKAKSKAYRGSEQDLNNANSMLAPIRPTDKPPMLFKRVQPQGTTSSAPRELKKLRDEFKRDSNATVHHHIKAKDKMRLESRNGRSSPDELDGGRTIPSHSSPHKESIRAPQSGVEQQQHSPTVVRQKSTGRPASPPSDDSIQQHDDERIAIKSIFSKQCVLKQKNLALVWDDEDEHLFVTCGNDMVRLPHRDTLVSIGKSDVGVSWTHNNTIAKAMLKGSSTECSNGIIVIEFEDDYGLKACYNLLYHAARDHMKSVAVVADQMEKVFQQQSKACTIAHQKLLRAGPPSAVATLSRRAGGLGQHIDVEDVDEIKYESAPTLSEVLANEQNARVDQERSPYFAQDNTRRSTRQAMPTLNKTETPTPPPRWSEVHPPVQWQNPVVYPSEGARRVTVYDSDISRLDDGEFLNDNLLGFAIRHIEESMIPEHKQKVHFFNTFFYSTLMRNKRKLDYDAVKRWTKNIDIFTVPYTVVPINNNLHWYFAIICNLQFLDRKLAEADGQRDNDPQGDLAGIAQSSIIDIDEEGSVEAPPRSTNVSDDGKCSDVITFDDDNRVAQAEVAAVSSRPSKKTKKKAASTRKYDTSAPVVIMLDSFGHARSVEINALKRYIQAEAEDKRAMDVDIGQIQGLNAKGLPEQPNFCDCGVYVIGYLTKFAKDPDAFVKKLLRREMDPQKDFDDFSAPKMRRQIRETLLEVAEHQDAERKAHKAQKKAKTAHGATSASTSKPASPVRNMPTTQATPTAVSRSTPAPALSASRSQPSSPIPTSHTAGRERSSPDPTTLGRTENNEEDDDDLEVSPPTGLIQAGGAPAAHEGSSSMSSDGDEEMLDVADDVQTSVPASSVGVKPQLPPNPYSHRPASSAASLLTTLPNRKTTSNGSVVGQESQDAEVEIADSQGRGYS